MRSTILSEFHKLNTFMASAMKKAITMPEPAADRGAERHENGGQQRQQHRRSYVVHGLRLRLLREAISDMLYK